MFDKKEYAKQYYLKNKENIKQYRINNKNRISIRMKKYYIKSKEEKLKYQKQYYIENKEERKEYWRQYQLKNKYKIIKYKRKWVNDNPEKTEKGRRIEKLKKYNMSRQEWLKFWEKQGGNCAICGEAFNKKRFVCIDHDHKTGKVRGLLCNNCNSAIGFLKDDLKLMARAIKYLKGVTR